MTEVRGSSAQYLDQIVAGHVRLVPNRDEARNPDAEPLRIVEDRQPQGAALRQHGDASARRIDRGERGVQLYRRIRVEEAHAVRPNQSASCLSNAVHERRFASPALSVAFAEACTDHTDGANLLGDAVVDSLEDLRCGHDDHREIDRSGNIDDPPVGGESFEFRRRRVHWHDRPRESGGAEIVQDLRSDFPAFTIGPDHRDYARFEERLHRRGGRGS